MVDIFSRFSFGIAPSSVADLLGSPPQLPIYLRSTPLVLPQEIDTDFKFTHFQSHCPAFFTTDHAVYVEPESRNYIVMGNAIGESPWIRGSAVFAQKDVEIAPNQEWNADRITWSGGAGNTQVLRLELDVPAATVMTFSGYIKLSRSSPLGRSDVVRFTGDVDGDASLYLGDVLNDYPGMYREVALSFKTKGTRPEDFPFEQEFPELTVFSVSTNSIVIDYDFTQADRRQSIALNGLAGAYVSFDSLVGQSFEITSNTAWNSVTNRITLYFAENIQATGVVASEGLALSRPPLAEIVLEFYIESTASLVISALQLESLPFHTSPILQRRLARSRSDVRWEFTKSPFSGLTSFFVFCHLSFWRGDGEIFTTDNLSIAIADGKLLLTIGNEAITLEDPLPQSGVKIALQVVGDENSGILWVNDTEFKFFVSGFVGALHSSLDFSSHGVRGIKFFCVSPELFLPDEVATVMEAESPISPSVISNAAPGFALPLVTVPAAPAPIARSQIIAINTGTKEITLRSVTNFVSNTSVAVYRDTELIINGVIISAINTTTKVVTASFVGQMFPGDFLVYGDYRLPGSATVRYPAEPIDPQIIESVNLGNKTITTTTSVTSFYAGPAYVITEEYQDVAEVSVLGIDAVNRILFCDSVPEVVLVGHTIYQPRREMLIAPANAFAIPDHPIDGIELRRYLNAVQVLNYNPFEVRARILLRAYL